MNAVISRSIAQALTTHGPALRQAHTDYKQHVVAINTAMTGVFTSSLPALKENPPDWSDFVTAYTMAKGDALDWVNNVLARLLNVPQEVQGYDQTMTLALGSAKTNAQTLVGNPSDQTALTALKANLMTLTQTIGTVNSFVDGTLMAIENFQNKLPDLVVQLQTIADRASTDAKVDQGKIDTLKQDIERLQSEIDGLTSEIVALAIVDAAALTLGLVASIVAFPEGLLSWFILAPAIAVATTYIVLDSQKITADQSKIAADQTTIDDLTADVAVLHLLTHTFAGLAAATQKIKPDLQAVLSAWKALEQDVTDAVTDINQTAEDTQSADFQKALNDIMAAAEAWTQTSQQAGALHIEIMVNNAELKVGLSAAEVKSASDQATSVDAITYYNSVMA